MRLETKRLILREWSKRDVKDIVRIEWFRGYKMACICPIPVYKKDAEEW